MAQRCFEHYRPGGVTVHAGSVILEPGLTAADFEEVRAEGVWLAKAGFGAVELQDLRLGRICLSTVPDCSRREHLQSYLDEFVFRFNSRRARDAAFSSLLGTAAAQSPVTYKMSISRGAAASAFGLPP